LDFRKQLELAGKALQAGDLARADKLYRAVATRHPGNTEALAGLGDVASRRGDRALAASYYDKVLTLNPSYLPAMMGSADQKWASGNQAGAAKLYRRVVEQVGESGYGQRAKQRLEQFEGTKPKPEAPQQGFSEGPSAEVPEERPAPPAEPEAPHIDTTDLPGFDE
jgi:Tfp pilus assembly protein PilF